MSDPTDRIATTDDSRANMALGIAVLALVLYLVAMFVAGETNDWLWPLTGVVGGAAAVMGWTSGKPRPRGKSLAAVILGGLIFLSIIGWIVVAMATGNS